MGYGLSTPVLSHCAVVIFHVHGIINVELILSIHQTIFYTNLQIMTKKTKYYGLVTLSLVTEAVKFIGK